MSDEPVVNHDEAKELAAYKAPISNLARCYLDLVLRLGEYQESLRKAREHLDLERAENKTLSSRLGAGTKRIEELEAAVRDRDEIIKGTAEQYASIVMELSNSCRREAAPTPAPLLDGSLPQGEPASASSEPSVPPRIRTTISTETPEGRSHRAGGAQPDAAGEAQIRTDDPAAPLKTEKIVRGLREIDRLRQVVFAEAAEAWTTQRRRLVLTRVIDRLQLAKLSILDGLGDPAKAAYFTAEFNAPAVEKSFLPGESANRQETKS